VLRIRRLMEEQAQRRLGECLIRIRAAERRLAEAEAWSEATARACHKTRLPAAEWGFVDMVLRRTQEAIREHRRQLQAEERRATELRSAYLKARIERRKLSSLREQAWKLYEAETARREQDELDEAFLRNRERASGASMTTI
jgi:flagellar export protein FliJ